jgi:hypothetical protein
MDPERGPPHPGVVVQVPGGEEFPGETIHHRHAAASRGHLLGPTAHRFRGLLAQELQPVPIGRPDLGPQFQPALPIGPPDDLLDELLDCREGVQGEHPIQDLLFRDEPGPDRCREA